MRSLYNEIISRKDKPTQEIFEYVNGICPELFEPLQDKSPKDAKEVLLYIIYAYSNESDYILKAHSWEDNKTDIAKLAGLADYRVDELISLKDETTKNVILAYLEWQGNREFRHLMTNKDMYDFLTKQIIKDMTSEEPKFEAMNEKRKWRDQLLEDINKMEEKLSQKYKPILVLQAEIKDRNNNDMDLSKSKFIS